MANSQQYSTSTAQQQRVYDDDDDEKRKKKRGDYVNFMAIWKMVGIGLKINDFSYFTSKRNFQDGNLQLLFEKPESIKEEIAQVHWRTKYNFRNDATVKWTHLC